MIVYDRGIRIAGTRLHLDAHRIVEFSFVSHGHTDHLHNHRKILATPATARFHQLRGRKSEVVQADYHEPLEIEGMYVELLPSGHILGAAQIFVERSGESLLYTGDFKTRPSAMCDPVEVRHADVLVVECTYGRPEYRFASTEDLVERLAHFVESCHRWGEVPVVLGYALGKAQEAVYWLNRLGQKVFVWPEVAAVCSVYREFGRDPGPYDLWTGGPIGEGVVVAPPHALRRPVLRTLGSFRSILLSGWAVDPGVRYRFGVDEAIPFSDHADFDELLEFVRRVQPRKVFTTHGFDDFAAELRWRGYDAWPLRGHGQRPLF
ncbi:MAG: MBL fold metallo-hydrolase [candidate division KSB1 bacterium]|nr:MBL fold metallo-hydrolase [candidate division KSB1 bacterium]